MARALSELRVWFVHDWLTGMRGGEKVLRELVTLFPRSRIATLLHVPGSVDPELERRVAAVSFLQRMPGAARGGWRNYLPLFPRAVRSLRLDPPPDWDGSCDLLISVSHAVAKGVRVPRRADGSLTPHLCYCNTPMRYIWGMEDHYLAKGSPKRAALAIARPALRRFDRRNHEVTAFIANSHTVAGRIKRIYAREAIVVYPGIDENFYVPPAAPDAVARENFYLVVSALVPYKRVDLAVRAFADAGWAGPRQLVIIGSGPEEHRLRKLAGGVPGIHFAGKLDDEAVRSHYQHCRGFLFPGEEDFGLTPVEAQACGAGVIAYGVGGATETVVENRTGIFFARQTVAELRTAVECHERTTLPPDACRENALRFTWSRFRGQIEAIARGTIHSPERDDAPPMQTSAPPVPL